MDNAQKAIMLGVGLFITIIIISVVLLITNLGTGMVDDARDNLGNMSQSLQSTVKTNRLKELYDRKELTGTDVASLYTQYKESKDFMLVIKANDGKHYSNKEKTGITEIFGNPHNPTYYRIYWNPSRAKGDTWNVAKFSSDFNTTHINSNAIYKAYLIKDDDKIIGVYCDKL